MCAYWFAIPALGELQEHSWLYNIKINLLQLETSKSCEEEGWFCPGVCGFNSSPQHMGIGVSEGCWAEHVCLPAPGSQYSLPLLQPLEMITSQGPKQIKALPFLPSILMDFYALFKIMLFSNTNTFECQTLVPKYKCQDLCTSLACRN